MLAVDDENDDGDDVDGDCSVEALDAAAPAAVEEEEEEEEPRTSSQFSR